MVKYISSLLSSINRIRRVIEVVITGLTRNQVIPNGTEGSNPSLSAKNKGYSVCYTLYSFVDKTARDSNPYNLLQDEVLSKEVYNRIVCGANSRANEVSRVPRSPPHRRRKLHIACGDFLFSFYRKSPRTHYAAPPLPKKLTLFGDPEESI